MNRQPIPRVEWIVSCDSCAYTRRFGAARLTAERKGVEHSTRYYDHVVNLIKAEIQHSFTRQGKAVSELGDDPPF